MPAKDRKVTRSKGRNGQRLVPHGTPGALKRHYRAGEEPCAKCKAYRTEYMKEYRARLRR